MKLSPFAAALFVYVIPALAAAQEQKFSERLLSAPFDTAMRPLVQGDGRVEASLDGRVATITGNFTGLSAPVTKVRVFSGSGPAIPGAPVFDLNFTPGQSGTFGGTLQLTARQAADLTAQKFYVRIDTDKAPEGALIAWLMPARAFPGEGVPEYGPAYSAN